MNFAKQLIKQAINDDHLLKFTTPDEQYDYYGKTSSDLLFNLHKINNIFLQILLSI